MKKIAIISTGSELIQGAVHEANCHYLSGKLFLMEFTVIFHITVGDNIDDLEYAVTEAVKKADIAIITGGLGPTDDDHTTNLLKHLYGFDTEIHIQSKNRMEEFFKSLNRELMQNDLKQVVIPKESMVFVNEVGLAAGYAVNIEDKTIIAMPGVPAEMRYMFENKVLPYLRQFYGANKKDYLIIRIILMREAQVNDSIREMNIDFNNIEWGITTTWGMNTVAFINKGHDFPLDHIKKEALRIFGDRLLSFESENIEEETIKLLKEKKNTISTAESCTGGLVSKRLTDIPGASSVFLGGIVSYSNESKINLLNVSPESLAKHGAVSDVVAKEMAMGVRLKFNSDIGISVTGIAGPGGGSEEKPVGTVHFGFSTKESTYSLNYNMKFERDRIRHFASQYALDQVRIFLKNNEK